MNWKRNVNRRHFLNKILKAGIAPMALPAALTYARAWRATETFIVPETTTLTQEEIRAFMKLLFDTAIRGGPRLFDNTLQAWSRAGIVFSVR